MFSNTLYKYFFGVTEIPHDTTNWILIKKY